MKNYYQKGQKVILKKNPKIEFTIKNILQDYDTKKLIYQCENKIGCTYHFNEDLIDIEPLEKEVEHIIEDQEEREVLEQYLQEKTSLTANQYIALELVKAWGQTSKSFDDFLNKYKLALKELAKAQN